MFPALTVGKQIAIGYAIALMFLLVTGLAAVRGTAALVATSEHVARSHEVLTAANELMATLVDAESGQRGFVVTGAEEFLEPYHESVAAVRTRFERLRALTRDDPRHQERLARAWPLIQAKLARNAETVEARRQGGFAAGQRLVASAVGKRQMDGIREAIDALMVEERGRLERRAEEAAAVAASTARMSLAATLLALLSVALSGLLITRALARRIDTGVQGLRSSSFELQAVANQQATAAGQQATSMNEIAATMREVIASSRQIAAGAQHVAHIAAETADAARAGTRAVGAAKEAMGTIQRHVDAIVGHMLDLGRKTQQIGAVVDITLELADQANIVAINATIEAAGAGEQGRRFAAVADELRKLADRVAASTKEIGPLVAEVRAAADTTVMATEGGAKAVDAGTHQFLELATAFDQIVRQVGATDEAAREIELSTHQQTTAVEQVHLAIGDAARAARETEASSQQTLQTATQLTSLSRELHALTRPAATHA